jgi:hypothetical protein
MPYTRLISILHPDKKVPVEIFALGGGISAMLLLWEDHGSMFGFCFSREQIFLKKHDKPAFDI